MGWAGRLSVAGVAAACLLWTGAAAAPNGGGEGGDLGPGESLARVVENLGSSVLAVRQRAEAQLAKVPREQLDALRQAEKGTTNVEVKSRLAERIAELELEPLLHPPKLSVDLKDATLADVAAALNQQMGAAYLQGDADAKVTVHAKDQPLWEILRQVNEQVPLKFTTGVSFMPPQAPIPTISMTRLPAGARPQPMFVVDGVCVLPAIAVFQPRNMGNWALFCPIYPDPRVRLTGNTSTLQMGKVIDQDDSAVWMPPLTSTSPRVLETTSRVDFSVAFPPALQVKVIKELRAWAVVEVVESQDVLTLDLTKEQKEPLATPLGRFTLANAGGGELTLTLDPAPGAGGAPPATTPATPTPTRGTRGTGERGTAPPGATLAEVARNSLPTMLVLDARGLIMQILPLNTGLRSWNIGKVTARGTRTATLLEIILSLQTRPATLPVVLKDLEIPPG